jgi:hypothetical protein
MATEKNLQNLSGKKRSAEGTEAIRFTFWRESHYGRQQQFREWRNVAMQVVDRAGMLSAFRLLAAFDEVFSLSTCDITASNKRLSEAAGHCATKTIQRGIADLEALGLIMTKAIWIDAGEKHVRGRRIELCLPKNLLGVHVPNFG